MEPQRKVYLNSCNPASRMSGSVGTFFQRPRKFIFAKILFEPILNMKSHHCSVQYQTTHEHPFPENHILFKHQIVMSVAVTI